MKGGSACHIFCRNPLILTDFYAIQTPIVWHILGAYFGGIFFANMGGGGGQNYFQLSGVAPKPLLPILQTEVSMHRK